MNPSDDLRTAWRAARAVEPGPELWPRIARAAARDRDRPLWPPRLLAAAAGFLAVLAARGAWQEEPRPPRRLRVATSPDAPAPVRAFAGHVALAAPHLGEDLPAAVLPTILTEAPERQLLRHLIRSSPGENDR